MPVYCPACDKTFPDDSAHATLPYVVKQASEERVDGNPCGCKVITFEGRFAVAVPCERHVGKMEFEMRPKA